MNLLDTGRIILSGEINEDTTVQFMNQIRYVCNRQENVYVYIHSHGGEFESACAIIDEIEGFQSLGFNINTIAIGKTYSAGAFILNFGNRRYITKNAVIMLHPISYEVNPDYHEMQKNLVDFHSKQYNEFISKIAKNSGHKSKQAIATFISSVQSGLWLNAKETIKYGIVDEIWDYSKELEIKNENNNE